MKMHIKLMVMSALILSITAVSCLKDKAFEKGSVQSQSQGSGQDIKVISLGLSISGTGYNYTSTADGESRTFAGVQFLQQSYALTDNDTTVDFVPVELGGSSDAAQDIHVTLTEDDQLVTTYNDSTGSSFTNPGPVITIVNPGNVVVIPKGSRVGYLQVKFKISDLLTGDFAFGFRITGITESGYTISGNLASGVVGIGPANEWFGDYTVTGFFFHPSAGRAIHTTKHISTASLIRNISGAGDLGTPFQFDVVNNQLQNWFSSGFASFNLMTADNPGGVDYSDASNGGNLPGDAKYNSTIYNNTYDPATKTFWMHYGYTNGGTGLNQNSFSRQIYEKWVKK